MKFFVLAAGEQTRWGDQGFKQLVDIDGVPLLQRTISQFSSHGEVFVVTHHNELSEFCRQLNVKVIDPLDHRFTASSALSTYRRWKGRTVILLGDVLYSDEAVGRIVACEDNFKVLGSDVYGEIFAMTFTDKSGVSSSMRKAVRDAVQGGRGKLWEVYRAYSGIPLGDHVYTHYFENIHDDLTRDFDTYEQYEEFLGEFYEK